MEVGVGNVNRGGSRGMQGRLRSESRYTMLTTIKVKGIQGQPRSKSRHHRYTKFWYGMSTAVEIVVCKIDRSQSLDMKCRTWSKSGYKMSTVIEVGVCNLLFSDPTI